ncbi:xanthine dehydrogenase family protein, partial [Candidatus Pacearchaeota archaeon]|nr:xanthine dehydrogenase family protein [Candidatus Pacearchaeota archaeon]
LTGNPKHVGDTVAAVAAVDPDIAEAALDLIDVEYRQLPFVLDPEEAMEPNAPQVHPEVTDNNVVTHGPLVESVGDVDQGFIEADFTLEERFTTQHQAASAMEPRVATASWDAKGKLTVWLTTQGTFGTRETLADVFGIPLSKIRCIQNFTGGGFGNKSNVHIESIATLLSQKAGLPVQLALVEKEEHIQVLRHPSVSTVKMGVKNDGTITAIQTRIICNTGSYTTAGIGVTGLSLWPTTTHRIVKCPNVKAEGYPVYTNCPTSGAYRGYGTPQGNFGVDSLISRAAERIGMDPVEFRKMNFWENQEQAESAGVPLCIFPGYLECLEKGAQDIGWANKWKGWNTPVATVGAKRRGIGIGGMAYMGGGGWFFGAGAAWVKISRHDGTVHLITGVCDISAGQKTLLAQVCAEALGISYEDVLVNFADTDTSPYSVGTFASRISASHGMAVKTASENARQQILEEAAPMLESNVEDLDTKDKVIFVKNDPSKSVSFADVLGLTPSDITATAATRCWLSDCSTFATQFFEVEVDTDTGQVEVLNVAAAHDCGTAANPAQVECQIYGGLMQGGIGYSICEDIILDQATGVTLNQGWLDYKVLTTADNPEIHPILVQPYEPTAPYGIKGVGEPPLTASAPGVVEAIYNAIGVRFNELPVTPDKILEALGKA